MEIYDIEIRRQAQKKLDDAKKIGRNFYSSIILWIDNKPYWFKLDNNRDIDYPDRMWH